jgi:hypothetical protein
MVRRGSPGYLESADKFLATSLKLFAGPVSHHTGTGGNRSSPASSMEYLMVKIMPHIDSLPEAVLFCTNVLIREGTRLNFPDMPFAG